MRKDLVESSNIPIRTAVMVALTFLSFPFPTHDSIEQGRRSVLSSSPSSWGIALCGGPVFRCSRRRIVREVEDVPSLGCQDPLVCAVTYGYALNPFFDFISPES
jgi:hypothetical protein